MKKLIFVLVLTGLISAMANSESLTAEQKFICNATDRLEQKSTFELIVHAETIRIKSDSDAAWKTLYSKDIGCSLKISEQEICSKKMNHNLDDSNRKYSTTNGRFRCIRDDNRPDIQLNGNFEINRFADGTGSFVCGTLPKHDLKLENCRFVVE